MRAILFIALLAVTSCQQPAYAGEWSLADMNRTIEQTNFVVNRGCSGTLIDAKNGYLLTANHCVADQYETVEREKIDEDGVVKKEKVRRYRDGTVSQLSFQGAESVRTVVYKVKLVAVDKDKDLALLQTWAKLPNTDSAPLACADPVRGETIYTVGNPMGSLYSSVGVGVVSSLQRSYDLLDLDNANTKQPLMQISSGIVGGNSGGAVYNVRGELVGVPVLGHRSNEVLGFAAPLFIVKEFLASNKLASLSDRCNTTPAP